MPIHDLPEHLFDWVSSIPYAELNAQQKKEVASFLSPEEYESIYKWLQGFAAVNEEMETQVKAVDSTPLSVHRLRAIWNYPVPLYQVAAVLLLVLAAWNVFMDVPGSPEDRQTVDPRAVSIEQGFYPDSLVFEL